MKATLRKLLLPLRRRIRGGPNRGMWFSLFTRQRFLRGTYEPAFAEFMAANIEKGCVFWDVGAHFGYYTLLASRTAGTIHSFEPGAENRRYLTAHVRWNGLDQVTIHDCALAAEEGEANFGGGRGPGAHRLGRGDERVVVKTIDGIVAGGVAPPDWLKIDVQGAEAQVLEGARATLASHPASVACATHSPEIHATCVNTFEAIGYRVMDSPSTKVVMAFGPGRPIPDFDVTTLDM